jgi:hypothetical protein
MEVPGVQKIEGKEGKNKRGDWPFLLFKIGKEMASELGNSEGDSK